MYHDPGGETIEIAGLACHLPPAPPKHLILGYNLPKKQQKWHRTPLPEFYEEQREEEKYVQEKQAKLVLEGKLKRITHYDPILERFRRQEWQRRMEGVWFYNNGEPVYLTGPHYYFLNWCKSDHQENDGYPVFYVPQLDRFYFRQYCQEDPLCLGYLLIGQRGFGKSLEEICMILEDMTRPPHRRKAAIQSKNEEDARIKIFKEKMVSIYKELPEFFKPVSNHGSNPDSKLSFYRPALRGHKSKKLKFGNEHELQNLVYPVGAREKELDGGTYANIFVDECGKTHPKLQADVWKRQQVNRFCVYRNYQKIGMIRATTTVEEMDEGGDECYIMWKYSDQGRRTENGFTISGLYRFFASCLDTTTIPEFIDGYGNIDKDKARAFHEKERVARKDDPLDLNSYIRKNPMYEEEAFLKDMSKSIFNVNILTKRRSQLNAMARQPWVRGNFYYLDKNQGIVDFSPDEQAGRFKVAKLLPTKGEEKATPPYCNNIGLEWTWDGKPEFYPRNDRFCGIGSDPIKYVKTTDPRASKAAAHGFLKYNDFLDKGRDIEFWLSHNLMFEYANRPDEFETYGEDMIMACHYYGCSINVESNISTLYQYFMQRNHQRFLTRRFDFSDEVVMGKKDEALLQSHPEIIMNYIHRIQSFVNRHGMRIPFIDTINQLIDFDPTKTTPSDLVVSLGYCLLEIEKNVQEEIEVDSYNNWMDEFDVTGATAKFIEDEEERELEEVNNEDLFW